MRKGAARRVRRDEGENMDGKEGILARCTSVRILRMRCACSKVEVGYYYEADVEDRRSDRTMCSVHERR